MKLPTIFSYVIQSLLTLMVVIANPAVAQVSVDTSASSSSTFPSVLNFIRSAASAPRHGIFTVPKTQGRLRAEQLGLVINVADPYSVEVGEFYIQARHLKPDQVLRLQLPVKSALTLEEFKELEQMVNSYFGPNIQALALAWRWPFAVHCNSITSAITLGYEGDICNNSCAVSRKSVYFNAATHQPWTDLKIRPSMLLAANDVPTAKLMIRRGVASDHSQKLQNDKTVNAYFLKTKDVLRNVRAPYFPPPGQRPGVTVHVLEANSLDEPKDVIMYLTGLSAVEKLDQVQWAPGALADHMTSGGGVLDSRGGQMMATDWITSGATASYGSVSEPCSHPQKFPHPHLLFAHYTQGATALEAYWKSVAWPQQGVLVGEPLAAPFAPR
jgi:uncharacterized protein (TIGR03790 family)